jgi:hypothetical protein
MPKTSKTTAAERTIVPGMIDSAMAELDGYLVEIQSFDVDIDMAFAAKGLPNDQCQATHVGYVVRGKVTLAPSSSPSHASRMPWPRPMWSGPT